MREAGPGPAPFMKNVKEHRGGGEREAGRFLDRFLRGSRKEMAVGLGSLIMLLSGAAAAQEGPRKRADRAFDELDEEVEEAKVTLEDVATARKSFDISLDLLPASPEAKDRIRKTLDETLSEIPDLEGKMETIGKFREQVEARLQKRETPAPAAEPQKAPGTAETIEPAATPGGKAEKQEAGFKAVVVFSSEKASGRVVEKKFSDGKKSLFVVEGEALVSIDDLVKAGLLKPDFIKFVKGFKNIAMARTTVEARMRTLFLLQEAAKAAKAQGLTDVANDLYGQVESMKERIKKNMGDIIP